MAAPTRTSPVASNTATSTTATFSEGTALGSTYTLIAVARRSATGSNPAPNAPGTSPTSSGWTLLSSASKQSAGTANYTGYNVWDGIYYRQGDGSVNSFTIGSAVSAWTHVVLLGAPNWKSPPNVADVPTQTIGNAASATIDGPDPGGVDALVVGVLGLTGTAGGTTGIQNTSGFTNIAGQSGASGAYFGYKSVTAAGEVDLGLTWTTSGHYAGVVVAFDTSTASTPIVAAGSQTSGTIVYTLTATSGGPITSVTAAVVSGPAGFDTGDISITGAVATITEVVGRTEAIVIDFTVNNASSTDIVRATFAAPGGGPVTLMEEIYTADGWVSV